MPSSRKQLLEALAAKEVERFTGARAERRDTWAEQAMRDFDIDFPDGKKGALEVTQLTMQNLEAIMGALSKYGIDIETTALARRWYLWLSLGDERQRGGAAIRDLRKNVVEFLAGLEVEGVTEFHSESWRSSSPAVDRLLAKFPLDWGTSSTIQEQPRVQILPPGTVGMAGAEALVEAIKAVAWLSDNRHKLDVEGLDERHLFVWVHPWLPAGVALDEPPPDFPICLPPEMSHLWIARNSSTPPRRLWRYSATDGWLHDRRA